MLVVAYNWVGLLNALPNTLRSLGEIEHWLVEVLDAFVGRRDVRWWRLVLGLNWVQKCKADDGLAAEDECRNDVL